MRLKDKIAIVTGGAQGIGRQYSLRLVEEGAAVALVDLRQEQAAQVAEEIANAGGKALAITADVTRKEEMEAMAQRVADHFGRIDILINNAALYYDLELREASIEYGRKVLDVNLFGVILPSFAVFPFMQRQQSGSVINIASIAAWPGVVRAPARRGAAAPPSLRGGDYYGLSKLGVIYLTQTLAMNFGPHNVRVNAIAPGVTMSEATRKVVPGTLIEAMIGHSALGRSLEPRDLTGTAVFLASDDSALMTGQCLVVDAGCKIS